MKTRLAMLPARWLIALLLLALVGGAFAPSTARAGGVVGNGLPGSCTEAALNAALAGGGAVTFNCGPAEHTITFTSSKAIAANTSIDGGGMILLSGGNSTGLFRVNSPGVSLTLANLTIRDADNASPSSGIALFTAGATTISNTTFYNNHKKAIFNQGGRLTISNSTFVFNNATGTGGAITNEAGGNLTLSDSGFFGNSVPNSQAGGALYNGANVAIPTTATILRCNFRANSAGQGGAIVNYGAMNISNSTIDGNGAIEGGGLYNFTAGALSVVNTTISGNTATTRGGGLLGGGTQSAVATLTNSTLADNTGPQGASIAVTGNASVTIKNTIAGNLGAAAVNCYKAGTGVIVDGGNNLQFPGTTCGGSIASADPQLGALQDNGGPTWTQALAAGSPARNAGNNAFAPAFDQRGVVRPQGGIADIGAFEYGAVATITSISPLGAIPAAAAFVLTVNGANFISGDEGSVVLLNNIALATTYVSPTQLTAIVPAGLLAGVVVSSVPVHVRATAIDGGTSSPWPFRIYRPVFAPRVMR